MIVIKSSKKLIDHEHTTPIFSVIKKGTWIWLDSPKKSWKHLSITWRILLVTTSRVTTL